MKRPDKLIDVGAGRIANMDSTGVTVQVLSSGMPGPELLTGAEAISVAQEYNDGLAASIVTYPGRYAGFATLPLAEPNAAAAEFRRAVKELGFVGALINGTTNDKFLDHPDFDEVLTAAEELDVPIYIHPNLPVKAVRDAYYSGLPGRSGFSLSMAGFGWHVETAVHVLRLVLSGAFDRHPKLKIIIGHMGETLPFMLDRLDDKTTPEAPHLSRSISQTILDQVWITTTGMYNQGVFLNALLTFGADRILFSVDYPYEDNEKAVDFLNSLPISPDDRNKIASGNADRLLKLNG